MNLENINIRSHLLDRTLIMERDNIRIEVLQQEDEEAVTSLIRRNLEGFDEHGSVLASTFRRLLTLYTTYTKPGSCYFVAKDSTTNECIGGAGIGPLHGLPPSEGVAEIRDLVVENNHRGQGLGSSLLKRCLDEVASQKYKRLYLESTPQMKNAHKLFIRTGFRAVEEGSPGSHEGELPCYFIKEMSATD